MDGGHDEIIMVKYAVPAKQINTTQFGKYLKMKKMIFSALDSGTSDRSLWSIVDNYRGNMYDRGALIALDRHQRGQLCEEICANHALEDITDISINPGFT